MASVSTNIKIDPVLKKEAQELFEKLGLNLSTAVNIFLRQSVREQGIPFYISAEEPNEETRRAIEDARKGIGLHGPFHSVEELMEDLTRPNVETIAAIEEVRQMQKDPTMGKCYTDVDKMMKDILEE